MKWQTLAEITKAHLSRQNVLVHLISLPNDNLRIRQIFIIALKCCIRRKGVKRRSESIALSLYLAHISHSMTEEKKVKNIKMSIIQRIEFYLAFSHKNHKWTNNGKNGREMIFISDDSTNLLLLFKASCWISHHTHPATSWAFSWVISHFQPPRDMKTMALTAYAWKCASSRYFMMIVR